MQNEIYQTEHYTLLTGGDGSVLVIANPNLQIICRDWKQTRSLPGYIKIIVEAERILYHANNTRSGKSRGRYTRLSFMQAFNAAMRLWDQPSPLPNQLWWKRQDQLCNHIRPKHRLGSRL